MYVSAGVTLPHAKPNNPPDGYSDFPTPSQGACTHERNTISDKNFENHTTTYYGHADPDYYDNDDNSHLYKGKNQKQILTASMIVITWTPRPQNTITGTIPNWMHNSQLG